MTRQTHDPSCAEPEIELVVLIKAAQFGGLLALVFLLFNFFMVGTLAMGLGLALAGGVFCGFVRLPAIRETFRRLENDPPVFPGETIIMEGYATHHRNFEGQCPGYLCLTDVMLHFRYYPFDGKLEDHIPLCEIDRIELYNHLWVWPSGIRLIMRNGKRQKFTVRRWRSGWHEELFRAWRKSIHRHDSRIYCAQEGQLAAGGYRGAPLPEALQQRGLDGRDETNHDIVQEQMGGNSEHYGKK